MKINVDLIYEIEEGTKSKRVSVDVRDHLKGPKLFDAIDKAVNNDFKEDTQWTRWNLIDIED